MARKRPKDRAISLRVTADDDALIVKATARVAGYLGDDVARSVVLRRALRRGLRSLIESPKATDEEGPRRPRS